ncbi:hypothetical protein BDW22DRAFT_714888 [Trametopsis cervina]|nr:hypothetical protein BDW22DRAFT_714888 [Trametopsis cervina]
MEPRMRMSGEVTLSDNDGPITALALHMMSWCQSSPNFCSRSCMPHPPNARLPPACSRILYWHSRCSLDMVHNGRTKLASKLAYCIKPKAVVHIQTDTEYPIQVMAGNNVNPTRTEVHVTDNHLLALVGADIPPWECPLSESRTDWFNRRKERQQIVLTLR